MEWDVNNIGEIVSYINKQLRDNKPMSEIEQIEFGVNPRVIHKRLLRLGAKKINNQYLFDIENKTSIDDITSNITPVKIYNKITPKIDVEEEIFSTVCEESEVNIRTIDKSLDIDKLNILLDNLDMLLKLIPSNVTSNTDLRSGYNCVKSFRVDSGLYKAIKDRASRDNISIADILNKSLEDYLNNYL